jgi:apolipoprotein N-acyltransferase
MFFVLLFGPLAFAWIDWLQNNKQERFRKVLSLIGLLVVSSAAILTSIAIAQVTKDKGRSLHVIQLERWIFSIAFLSIPFLFFGRRMTRWLGLVSAVLIPIATSFIDTLY